MEAINTKEDSMDSILTSIKKLLGIGENDINFDVDILVHINTALAILPQIGISNASTIYVEDSSTTWNSLIGNDYRLNLIKTYVYQKVKLAFDPPSSSAAIEALTRSISELEWRINIVVETE